MRLYLAPLEGITTHVYRNAVYNIFGNGADKYFTPFFAPQTKRHANSYAIQGILPENNEGIYLVPQILTDEADDFFRFEKDMRDYGYNELNINIGCPSGTVVSKGRGSAFLSNPEKLDHFLEEVYAHTRAKVSVKTRLGMHDPEEIYHLMDIFNKYPMEELILHARVGDEMYSGHAHRDYYSWAKVHSKNRLVYNGDIFRKGDELDIPVKDTSDTIDAVPGATKLIGDTLMLGRGMVADPSLIRQLNGGAPASAEEMRAFIRRLKEDYLRRDPDERHCLEKLKEISAYLKAPKKAMKAKRLEEFQVEIDNFLSEWSGIN